MLKERYVKQASQEELAKGAFNTTMLRNNTTIPELAWEHLDAEIVPAFLSQLVGIKDLQQIPSLVKRVDGTAASTWGYRATSNIGNAIMAMDPDTRGMADRIEIIKKTVPLYITSQNYYLNIREVKESIAKGVPLDTITAEEAAKSVGRSLEQTLFSGHAVAEGAELYGYTTFPDRQTATIADWSSGTTTGETIVSDVLALIDKSVSANHFGPWHLYIPTLYRHRMGEDYKEMSAMTIEQRILSAGVAKVGTAEALDGGNVVLVEMTSSTVRLIEGMPLTNLLWEPEMSKNWNQLFKVMTIMVPLLISDFNGDCGIVHGTV